VSVKSIVDKCEELVLDCDFSYVKEWKSKNSAKAVGFLPIYVPRELIHASGMLPVGIMGAGESLEIIKGDAYFQSYICHIPRSTIELGVTGRLDCLDGLLCPAICDVIRNISGMWKLLFKNKYVKYVDLPQNFSKDIGGSFYQGELSEMKSDFEEISGNKITDENLNRSIKLYNENRQAIEKLYSMRVEAPHLIPTFELYVLMRASNILEVEEHTALVHEYLEKVIHEKRPERDNIRVVLTGAFCEQPPLGLIRSLENSGCYIVDDDWILGSHFLRNDIPETENPLEAITNAYLGNTVETASRYIKDEKKGEFLIQQVRDTHSEGVIFAAPSFCDPALLERPMLQEALSKENIPYTSFKYAENTGQFQVIKEQTGTFSDSIKLWEGR
jgi:benzoyl-CoA reductase subunit C